MKKGNIDRKKMCESLMKDLKVEWELVKDAQ